MAQFQRSTPNRCAAAAIWTRGSIALPSLAAAGVLEYRWLKRWKVFENFVREQMAATAQGQLDRSTYESLAGSMVPRQEDVKVQKKESCQSPHWRGRNGEEEAR